MQDLGISKREMVDICQRARSHLDEIFGLLEKYRIPVTWGIVGHLLVHRNELARTPHSAVLPARKNEWDDEPAFYGKDVVDKIMSYVRSSQVAHDVGCHSFSHQLFGGSNCNQATAEFEVTGCISVFRDTYGIVPRVFIFPKNYVGHLGILRKNGFVAFRGPIPSSFKYSDPTTGIKDSFCKYASWAIEFMSFYMGMSPPVADPKVENNLLNIPASMCFNKKPFIPIQMITGRALKGIDEAVRRGKAFHLFTHEVNFGQMRNPTPFLGGFEKILAYAERRRERNELEITTISNVVHHEIEIKQ